jgi:hypothetical protein
MADPFPELDLVRIIFERGLQLLKADDRWLIPSSERLERIEAPGELEAAFAVRRIICDTQFNVPFFQPRRVIDPAGQPVSRARYLKGYVEDSRRRIYKYMVEHYLYCAVAHLGYLAEAYGGLAVLHNDNRWGLPEHARDQSRAQLHDSALRHGEAVFTSLSSALDASRFLVWREKSAPPDTIPETLNVVMTRTDPDMRAIVEPLEELWYGVGERLLLYRDCCAEFHPFTELGGRCGGELNEGDVWEMHIDVPDNPDAHSRDQFTFSQGIDLLDYSWRTTCAVVRCIEAALPQVHARAVLGEEPSRWGWLLEG